MASFFDYPGDGATSSTENYLFLPTWDAAQWTEFVKYCEARRYHPGEVVIAEGDVERAIYIIQSGRFEVLFSYARPGRRAPDEFEAGAVIGEISFLDGKPRSATVRALTDGEMLKLSIESLEVLMANNPSMARQILLDLGRLLALRLRVAESLLRAR